LQHLGFDESKIMLRAFETALIYIRIG
jgi:hypothetical protein